MSPSPGGVAGFTLGILVALVLLSALSLSARQVGVVAALAAVAEILLQWRAGIRPGAWVGVGGGAGLRLRGARSTWSTGCGRWWPA